MSHAITVGGLLGSIVVLAGIVLFAVGMLSFFAGAMSDAPREGDAAGKLGCALAVGGVVLFAVGLWGAFQ